tara:strand:+ start:3307 stop:3564 length:258 start_codon:yes stop_codon:yes gene_type:complete
MNGYRNLLKNNICEVSFIKLDGDARVMTCTLKEDTIPFDKKPKSYPLDGTQPRKPSETTIAAFDTNAQDWRSFRIDSVTEFKVLK